jgi:hypothetical protein
MIAASQFIFHLNSSNPSWQFKDKSSFFFEFLSHFGFGIPVRVLA